MTDQADQAEVTPSAAEYEPTENQLAVLHAFQASKYLGTQKESCRAAGVDRGQYHRWFHNSPGFAAWWEAQAETFFHRGLPAVHARVADSAAKLFGRDDPKPDTASAKLFMERFDKGFVPRSRKDIEGNVKHDHSHTVSVGTDRLSELHEAAISEIAEDDEAEHPAADETAGGDAG